MLKFSDQQFVEEPWPVGASAFSASRRGAIDFRSAGLLPLNRFAGGMLGTSPLHFN
jgi:hypothetical protein